MTKLPAITLRGPWAWFIRAGWKTIETRGRAAPWDRLAPRPYDCKVWVAIHQGLTEDASAVGTAWPYLSGAQRAALTGPPGIDLRSGAGCVIAVARVADTARSPKRSRTWLRR